MPDEHDYGRLRGVQETTRRQFTGNARRHTGRQPSQRCSIAPTDQKLVLGVDNSLQRKRARVHRPQLGVE